MPPGEEVSFEPPLQRYARSHLHDSAITDRWLPSASSGRISPSTPLRSLVNRIETVWKWFHQDTRNENSSVFDHNIPQKVARGGGFSACIPPVLSLSRRSCESRADATSCAPSPIGDRIGAHAAVTDRRQLFKFRNQFALPIKQFIRLIAFHPFFQQRQVAGLSRTSKGTGGLAKNSPPCGPLLPWVRSNPWDSAGLSSAIQADPRAPLCVPGSGWPLYRSELSREFVPLSGAWQQVRAFHK